MSPTPSGLCSPLPTISWSKARVLGTRPLAPVRSKVEFCPGGFAAAAPRTSYVGHWLAGVVQAEKEGHRVCQDLLPHLSFMSTIHARQQLPKQVDGQRTLRLPFLDRRRRRGSGTPSPGIGQGQQGGRGERERDLF